MPAAVSAEARAQIQELWETTTLRQGEIARQVGLHVFLVANVIRQEKWQRQAGGAPAAVATAHLAGEASPAEAMAASAKPKGARKKAATRPTRAQVARDALVLRLYRAIATKLTKLEERMADGQPSMTPEESERHTREIGSMIQGFEKVTEVAADAAKSDSAVRPVQPVVTTLADIARVRRELAERLHRAWGRPNS